ncbi:MAG TPA: RluA family pseudouridine synthase [Rhodospirillaceae bacterium]|nr:RluA family pseudouridine synthase [Rhodospirillaceae bacterium]
MEPKTTQPHLNTPFPHVTQDEAGLRLDRWFKRHFPVLSHGQLQKMLRTGQIRVDGKRADSAFRLEEGQILRLPPALTKGDYASARPEPADGKRPLRNPDKLKGMILYQDEDVVAINKPAGLAVQGGTGLKENLDDSLMALSLDGVTRPKLVHRLDRDTSGVLLIARNDYAAMKLSASFRARSTQKIYWAATVGVPSPNEGRIDAPLVKNGQLMTIAEEDDEEAKSAATLYRVVESIPKKMAFVALWPLTGRTHQLRVHLAHLGTPIWKDRLYGIINEEEEPSGLTSMNLGDGLHLHARRLIIPHPRKGVIDVTAPLSASMKKTWRCFGFSEKAVVDFDDL